MGLLSHITLARSPLADTGRLAEAIISAHSQWKLSCHHFANHRPRLLHPFRELDRQCHCHELWTELCSVLNARNSRCYKTKPFEAVYDVLKSSCACVRVPLEDIAHS
ncbi:hypothetical protein RRG08_014337 [Elysia crispata]|uniref:Uncharacterized protein n=1 Tax=Elysia crispata TaxID=231223 RepID=A0AAE1CJ90_9GAST|nr:hypothetical protein RRG08_014337 [Elysia crispata]